MGIFFEHFTKFKGRALHLAGESYGVSALFAVHLKQMVADGSHYQGRYIPVFASAIYDKNTELVEAGLTPINLTSIMLGRAIRYELVPCLHERLTMPPPREWMYGFQHDVSVLLRRPVRGPDFPRHSGHIVSLSMSRLPLILV